MAYPERPRHPDVVPSQPSGSDQILPAPRGIRVINPENIQGGPMSVSGFSHYNLADLGRKISTHQLDMPQMAVPCLIEPEPQARVQQYRVQQPEPPSQTASYPQGGFFNFTLSPPLASASNGMQHQQHQQGISDINPPVEFQHDTEMIPYTMTQPQSESIDVNINATGQAGANTNFGQESIFQQHPSEVNHFTHDQPQVGTSTVSPNKAHTVVSLSPGHHEQQLANGNRSTDDHITDPTSFSTTAQQALRNGEGRLLTLDEVRFRYNHLKRIFDADKVMLYSSMRDPAYVVDEAAKKCCEMRQRELILAQMAGCIIKN